MSAIDDSYVMPFGKHRGLKIGDVPADYLLWLWNNGLWDDNGLTLAQRNVHDYIRENVAATEMDAKDTIITHDPRREKR